MEYTQAATIAERIGDLLAPACEQIAVAGSIRRGKAEVEDIEIVAVSKIERLTVSAFDLFGGEDRVENNLLEECVSELIATGALRLDPVVKRNGPKYKRFMLDEGIALELFIATPTNYGAILAIRTGNAEFSKALVTPRRHGGLMPGNMHQRDGLLWRNSEVVPTPTEAEYFAALGLAWVQPERRTAEIVPELLRAAVEAKR